jgi:hypothetical protein
MSEKNLMNENFFKDPIIIYCVTLGALWGDGEI